MICVLLVPWASIFILLISLSIPTTKRNLSSWMKKEGRNLDEENFIHPRGWRG
jgi:hypothetical protein